MAERIGDPPSDREWMRTLEEERDSAERAMDAWEKRCVSLEADLAEQKRSINDFDLRAARQDRELVDIVDRLPGHPRQEQGGAMIKRLLFELTPFGWDQRGPYADNDWRSRLRRFIQRPMPRGLQRFTWRVEMAVRFQQRLHTVPTQGIPLPAAWIRERDVRRGREIAERLGMEEKRDGEPKEAD